jgi:hypothetical protein
VPLARTVNDAHAATPQQADGLHVELAAHRADRAPEGAARALALRVAGGARAIERFFGHTDCERKISRLSISRSERVEKSRDPALRQSASTLGQANCFIPIARFRIGIRCKQPREFVQHSRRVRGICSDLAQPLQSIGLLGQQ